MVGMSGKERSSWSVLMPSATQQQHHSNLERFLQCVTPTPPSKFLPQVPSPCCIIINVPFNSLLLSLLIRSSFSSIY